MGGTEKAESARKFGDNLRVLNKKGCQASRRARRWHFTAKYLDADLASDHRYLVTEQVEGGNLADYVRSLQKGHPKSCRIRVASSDQSRTGEGPFGLPPTGPTPQSLDAHHGERGERSRPLRVPMRADLWIQLGLRLQIRWSQARGPQ